MLLHMPPSLTIIVKTFVQCLQISRHAPRLCFCISCISPLNRIRDTCDDLTTPERVCLIICGLIEEHVIVCVQLISKAAFFPEIAVECFPCFRVVVEGVLLVEVILKPCECAWQHVKGILICAVCLFHLLFFRVQPTLTHWKAHVRCLLENSEMLHNGTNLL